MGYTILVAEDDSDIVELIELYLENDGYRVLTAADGVSALELVRREQIDLAVLDIMMPRMNGYEAARQIRAMARADARTIPIFAITADAFAEDVEAAKQAGMNSHLAKPLDIPHMMGEIQKYLHA